MIVTKQLINDLKHAENVVIRFNEKDSQLELSNKDTLSRCVVYPFQGEARQTGSWVLFTYPQQITHQGSIFSMLKAGDDIRFYVSKNGTEALTTAGFQWLVLMVRITRHRKDGKTLSAVWNLELDQQVISPNATRFMKAV